MMDLSGLAHVFGRKDAWMPPCRRFQGGQLGTIHHFAALAWGSTAIPVDRIGATFSRPPDSAPPSHGRKQQGRLGSKRFVAGEMRLLMPTVGAPVSRARCRPDRRSSPINGPRPLKRRRVRRPHGGRHLAPRPNHSPPDPSRGAADPELDRSDRPTGGCRHEITSPEVQLAGGRGWSPTGPSARLAIYERGGEQAEEPSPIFYARPLAPIRRDTEPLVCILRPQRGVEAIRIGSSAQCPGHRASNGGSRRHPAAPAPP